jgi:hypothetical protein
VKAKQGMPYADDICKTKKRAIKRRFMVHSFKQLN